MLAAKTVSFSESSQCFRCLIWATWVTFSKHLFLNIMILFAWISSASLSWFLVFSLQLPQLTTCPPFLTALVRSSGYRGQHGPRASRFGSQRLGPGSAPRWSPRGQPSRSGTKGTEKWHEIFHGEWMGLLPQNGSPTKDDWPEVIPMRSRQRINPKNGHFYDGFCGIWRGFFPLQAWIIVHWW